MKLTMRRCVVAALRGCQRLRVTVLCRGGTHEVPCGLSTSEILPKFIRRELAFALVLLELTGCQLEMKPESPTPAQRCAAMCGQAGLDVASFENGWECRCSAPTLRCDAAWNRADAALGLLNDCQSALQACVDRTRGGGL